MTRDEKRLSIAGSVLRAVQGRLDELARVEGLQLDEPLGATVILHRAKLESPDPEVCLASTLSCRSESRLVMVEALVGSVIADGGSPESAFAMAERDIEVVFGRSGRDGR